MLLAWIGIGLRHPDLRPGVADSGVQLLEGAPGRLHFVTTSGLLATAVAFVLRFRQEHDGEPDNTAAAGFGGIELLAKAACASVASHGEIADAAARDDLVSTSTETVLGPYGVVPAGQPGRGRSQRLVVRLQLQWQGDGEGGLVQRVIYPDEAAERQPGGVRPSPHPGARQQSPSSPRRGGAVPFFCPSLMNRRTWA